MFVSISLIFLIFTIGISRFSFFNFFLLKNELGKMFDTSYYLQQRAISENSIQELFIDEVNNSYFYLSNDKKVENRLPGQITFGFLPKSFGPPLKPSKAIQKFTTFKVSEKNKYRIRFFPNGACDSGSLYLIDENGKFMVALTSSISKVAFLRKYQYSSGKWKVI